MRFNFGRSKRSKAPKKSPSQNSLEQNIRLRLVNWALTTFSGTILLSGLLMIAVAISPVPVDHCFVENWVDTVLTAQISLMGAACSYYFGRQHGSNPPD